MRFIDRWLGVPLTMAVSVLAFFTNLWQRDCEKPENVLLIKLSEMGSTVCAEPALRAIEKASGQIPHIVVFKENSTVFSILEQSYENRLFTIRSDSFINLVWDTFRFLFWAHAKGFDGVVDFELFSCYSALLAFFSGASRRVGFHCVSDEGLYRGDLFNRRVVYSNKLHISENYLNLADALLAPVLEGLYQKEALLPGRLLVTKKELSAADIEAVNSLLLNCFDQRENEERTLVVVNVNASELLPQRRWPVSRFTQLIGRLLELDKKIHIVLTGSRSEREGLQQIVSEVSSQRCAEIAGKISLIELLALLDKASAFVSNDSGPGHFASKSAVSTLVLFGPETPALYRPLGEHIKVLYADIECSPCVSAAEMKKCDCINNVCMQSITVEQVFEEVKSMLSKR